MEKVFSLEQLPETAQWVWEQAGDIKVLALHGEMGAGKTTLVHALCRSKGVTDVTGSPTFSLINEYAAPGSGRIYHLDLYRLRDEEEAIYAGVEIACTVVIPAWWNGRRKRRVFFRLKHCIFTSNH